MKIHAVIASEEHKNFSYEEVEVDDPRDDEILVKIEAVGLCHTDVIARDGLYQLGKDSVLGHEGAGIVEKIGTSVTKVKPGDRVSISFRRFHLIANSTSSENIPAQQFDDAG